jgi:hypothetical protein
VANRPALDGQHGTFEVKPSELPGKLRIHPDDPRQFAFDNGEWFLHLGDTAYRFVTDTEPLWQQYIDEAAQVGFNKIRTWFCRGRHDVAALFTDDRQGLDLAYWDEIERRLGLRIGEVSAHPVSVDSLRRGLAGTAALWRRGSHFATRGPLCPGPVLRLSEHPVVHFQRQHISPGPGARNADPATIHRSAATCGRGSRGAHC